MSNLFSFCVLFARQRQLVLHTQLPIFPLISGHHLLWKYFDCSVIYIKELSSSIWRRWPLRLSSHCYSPALKIKLNLIHVSGGWSLSCFHASPTDRNDIKEKTRSADCWQASSIAQPGCVISTSSYYLRLILVVPRCEAHRVKFWLLVFRWKMRSFFGHYNWRRTATTTLMLMCSHSGSRHLKLLVENRTDCIALCVYGGYKNFFV